MKPDDQTPRGASDRAEKSRTANKPREHSDFAFVRVDDQGKLNYWTVSPSGDDEQDFETGQEIYRQAVAFAELAEDSPQFLCLVIRDMFAVGRFGHLEAGFIGVFAMDAVIHQNSLRCPRPERPR